jgi:Dyp-type peroxidase family
VKPSFDPLDREDIQGNVLRPYGFDHAGYVFVRIDDDAAGRAWLGELVGHVTTAEPWNGAKPVHTLNVGVTSAGLTALGVPQTLLDSFSPAFRQGMRARAVEHLGDSGASAPDSWDEELRDGARHVLLTVNARDRDACRDRMRTLRDEVEARPGLAAVHEQEAGLLQLGPARKLREHFGFSDGMSQPAVEHSGMTPRLGQGTPTRHGWRPLKVGELILGYEDEDRVRPDAPAPPLGDNGTYMVYRKLRQDVGRYRRFVREAAAVHDLAEDLLAAKIVGRWYDGSPLELAPDHPDPDMSENVRNDFRYRDDGGGWRCPLGAHIRRTNPRDALGWDGVLTKRHRIVRRGMPYGDPLPDGELDDDGADRGLIFICFNASIERQFETVQGWCRDGNIFGLGPTRDFLTAPHDGEGYLAIQGRRPRFLPAPEQPFVLTRGGEYLFVPGIDALRALAAGFPAGAV